MQRQCRSIPIDDLLRELGFSGDQFKLYADSTEYQEIIEFLDRKAAFKKFRVIVRQITTGRYNPDLYDKEDVSGKAKGVTAMKFKGKANYRVYCKEYHDGRRRIVMIQLIWKKTQKNDKQLRSRLETLGGYDYEFQSETE